MLLSLFFYFITPLPAGLGKAAPLTIFLLLSGEALYGFALGLIIALLFSVVRLSGLIIEQQMGLTMSEILDPLTENESSPFGSLRGDGLRPAVPERQRPSPVPAGALQEL